MDAIYYISEKHILLFLIQVFVLLSAAKTLGGFFHRRGYPALAGEILTGILLGPTVLGRTFPLLFTALFPCDLVQQNMLETVSWLGILFLLLATGFEVNLTSALKQGKAAFTIGIVGVIIPFVLGIAAFWWFPRQYWGFAANRLTFTLFMSTAAAISAIAVIARILHDLDILKSDLGLVTISGFVVNDLVGWLVFAFVIGFVSRNHPGTGGTLRTFFEVILFGVVCLSVGSKLVGLTAKKLNKMNLPHPATVLAFITCMAMLCGAITQWIGVHAILGFFLAGIMAGNTTEISERTREVYSQMAHSVFVPLFFASIGLKVDFLQNINYLLILIFTVVAIGGKFMGAWIGARISKMSHADSLSVGIAFIPGGAMEIILGLLALEIGLISETGFVAIVFAALSSSIAIGPLLAWSIKRRRPVNIASFLFKDAIIANLQGKSRWEIIPELCARTAAVADVDVKEVTSVVLKREEIMGTGFENGIAIPHGRLKNIKSPIITFGRSSLGIDWDARDGLATHYVFLVLTPEKEEGVQVQILAAIAQCITQPDVQNMITQAQNSREIFEIIKEGLMKYSATKNG